MPEDQNNAGAASQEGQTSGQSQEDGNNNNDQQNEDGNTAPVAGGSDTSSQAGGQSDGGQDDGDDDASKMVPISQLRKKNNENENLRKRLKRFEEEEEKRRKAAMTEQQRLEEERNTLQSEVSTLREHVRRANFERALNLPDADLAWGMVESLGIEIKWDGDTPKNVDTVRKALKAAKPRIWGDGDVDAGDPSDGVQTPQTGNAFVNQLLRGNRQRARR